MNLHLGSSTLSRDANLKVVTKVNYNRHIRDNFFIYKYDHPFHLPYINLIGQVLTEVAFPCKPHL